MTRVVEKTPASAPVIAPGTQVKDLNDTVWTVWGTNRQGMAILSNTHGVVCVQHVNNLTRVGP